MSRKLHIIQITFIIFFVVLCSCKNSRESVEVSEHSAIKVQKEIESTELGPYSHRVTGTDENGNDVHGNINIEGKIGLGTLIKKDTTDIEIVVEWVSKQKLKATDLEGYEYDLTIK